MLRATPTAPPAVTDAELTEKFRDITYRAGWLEFQLEFARDELTATLPHLSSIRRIFVETRICSINRTLRLMASINATGGAR